MKKSRFTWSVGLLLFISLFVFAVNPLTTNIRMAFEKMYPKAVNVEWSQKGDYHIADFIMNRHEINVWFDARAQWVMTETDVESLDSIPNPVAEAFIKSAMTSMQLEDVRIITFPQKDTIIVIEVEGVNFSEEFQLFYAPNGTLLRTLNVSVTGGEIYPELFN